MHGARFLSAWTRTLRLGFLLSACAAATVWAQDVRGVRNFVEVVRNLDQAITFYRDGVGLAMEGDAGPRTFAENAAVASLFNAPGARSRTASFKIPDSEWGVEIVEFEGLTSTATPARFFDAGAVHLGLIAETVQPVTERLARIKGLDWASASTLTRLVGDHNGVFLNLRASRLYGLSTNLRVELNVVVKDRNKATDAYLKALNLWGRGSVLTFPDDFDLRFSESTYVEQKVLQREVHDPGVGVLQIRVGDFDAALKALAAAGATAVSARGEPVRLVGGRSIILHDTNNFYLQLMESR